MGLYKATYNWGVPPCAPTLGLEPQNVALLHAMRKPSKLDHVFSQEIWSRSMLHLCGSCLKMGKPQIHWDLSMLKWLELGGLVQHSPSTFSQTYIIPVLSHEIPMKIDSQWAPGDLPGKGLLRSPGTAYLPSNLHLGCRLAHFHGDILWCFYWQSNEDILGIPNGYDIIVYIYKYK